MGLRNQRVLICGASIAGPTLAYWLARHGFSPTLVERAPGPREGGSPIDVRGPAVGIAERMGISSQLRAADTATQGLSFVDAAGAQRSSLDLRAIRVLIHELLASELPRGELVRILHGVTTHDVEYLFNDSITALPAHGDHHTAYAQYERTHRPRVRAIHRKLRIARALMVPATTGAIWRRNQLSRLSHLLPALI